MKTEEFTRKDGTTGTKYTPEKDDEVTSNYGNVRKNDSGLYTNYSLGVTYQGMEIYITLTGGQAKKLESMGDLNGKTLTFYEYENKYKPDTMNVGVNVKE